MLVHYGVHLACATRQSGAKRVPHVPWQLPRQAGLRPEGRFADGRCAEGHFGEGPLRGKGAERLIRAAGPAFCEQRDQPSARRAAIRP
jgi:hypothetical protein